MHSLRRMLALPRSERRLLSQAWCLLLAVDLGLRLISLHRVQTFLRRAFPEQRSGTVHGRVTALRAQALVAAAAQHHLVPMTCLRQALVLQWLLARREIATELRIGVRREADRLMAHAWLELDGAALGPAGSGDPAFVPLLRAGERLTPS
jgi:hypothetical protein